MGRAFIAVLFAQQFEQHVGKPGHRPDDQPVRAPGQSWQGIIGAKYIARTVHEHYMGITINRFGVRSLLFAKICHGGSVRGADRFCNNGFSPVAQFAVFLPFLRSSFDASGETNAET